MKKLTVSWFSAGMSSFLATYYLKPDRIVYIDIDDQHADTARFIDDCKPHFLTKIEVIQSVYKNVDEVQQAFGFIKSAFGAKCTGILKKRVRKDWELHNTLNSDITYVWGMDFEERHRRDRIVESMPEFKHEFPLIDRKLTKTEVHEICSEMGLKRPIMYDMGYPNNNCIGCVKGGIGYWNKIRKDFPEVFKLRSKREREIGHSILKDKNGKLFLDELSPNRGRNKEIKITGCNVMCQLNLE